MKYETIPYVDKPVSRILFGTAQPSFLRGEENNAILDAALEAGITTFDTARNYALSEKTIGTWLRARDCRDQVVILSKCAHPDDDGTKRVSEAAIIMYKVLTGMQMKECLTAQQGEIDAVYMYEKLAGKVKDTIPMLSALYCLFAFLSSCGMLIGSFSNCLAT
jgi:diketogulonate reductase-like aldo/keto reductase